MAEEPDNEVEVKAPTSGAAEAEAPSEAKAPGEAAPAQAEAPSEAKAPGEAAPAQAEAPPAAKAPREAGPTQADPDSRGRGARFRGQRGTSTGVVHIKATFNNTIVTIADAGGNVVSWGSAGRAGFKGCRKSTAFAATVVAQDAARQAVTKGIREVEIRVQGAGSGRESAVRAVQSAGMNISVIKDVTPVPHNGCRARKRRRV